MLAFLPKWLVGSFAFIIYWVNSFFWFIPLFTFALLKIIPLAPTRKLTSYILDACASGWVSINTFIQHLTIPTRFDVDGVDGLSEKEWYMVVSNHQSWVDIMVVQRLLNRKTPFIKFFLKRELMYVPFFGLAWWALDFPFMVRYTKDFIRKNPHLKGKDVETTKKACEKFRYKPVSVMNFVEGTRFTEDKHQRQGKPFEHLLRPKAGGTAFVLGTMGESLHKIINITIVYPGGIPTFWQYISGQVDKVIFRAEVLPITPDLIGDYDNDTAYRKQVQGYINQLWQDKDRQMRQLLEAEQGD